MKMIPLPPSRPGASPRVYDAFIAIDWSGAVKANGIAIAEADARRRTVRPVPPPPGGWTRLGAMIWLAARLRRGPPACVGVDCAFGLPYEPGIGYLDGRVPGVADLFSLWDVVEDAAGAAPDLGGGPVVDDPRFAPSFWRHGPTPPHWRDGAATRRLVERVAAARRLGNPVSVFKLAAASKQVGKASLAGMRALRHLRDDLGDALAVWPVETPRPGQSVALEIFPTLFRRPASGMAKLRDWSAMAAALAHFQAGFDADWSRPGPGDPQGGGEHLRPDDHLGDAIIAAAGMMVAARAAEVWRPMELDAVTARTEGWIFGVP